MGRDEVFDPEDLQEGANGEAYVVYRVALTRHTQGGHPSRPYSVPQERRISLPGDKGEAARRAAAAGQRFRVWFGRDTATRVEPEP